MDSYDESSHYDLSEIIRANYISDENERLRLNLWILANQKKIAEFSQGASIIRTAKSSVTNILAKRDLYGEVLHFLHIDKEHLETTEANLVKQLFEKAYDKKIYKEKVSQYNKLKTTKE